MKIVSSDPVVRRQATTFARERRLPTEGPDAAAAVVVIDLSGPDAVDAVRDWRASCPEALIIGCTLVPDRARLEEAERAGCDAVGNRGALGHLLRRTAAAEHVGRRRAYLTDLADVAGRLGLILRVPRTPVGPVALYQVGGRLVAASDTCPHAGACLSEGSLEDTVVTCPAHGSRFDLAGGDRVRGPSDRDLAIYDVVIDGGRVYLSWV